MSKNNIGGVGYQLDNLANPVSVAGLTLLADGLHSGNNIDMDQHDILDVQNLNVTNVTATGNVGTGTMSVGALTVTGLTTTGTANVTGLATMGSATVTGLTSTGTANVTGLATMGSATVTGTSTTNATPTQGLHTANKNYVDAQLNTIKNRGHSKFTNSVQQTFANDVDTIMVWNTQNYSSGNFTINLGTGTFTCAKTGTYIIMVSMSCSTSQIVVYASVNGVGEWALTQNPQGGALTGCNISFSWPFFFSIGQTFSIRMETSSGTVAFSPLNTQAYFSNKIFIMNISDGQ